MRRSDRQDSDDDNRRNNPRSRQPEPEPPSVLKARNATLRSRNKELREELEATRQSSDTLQVVQEQLGRKQSAFLDLQDRYEREQVLLKQREVEIKTLQAAQRDFERRMEEWKQRASANASAAESLQRGQKGFEVLYIETLSLYQKEQDTSQQHLASYREEQAHARELLSQNEEATKILESVQSDLAAQQTELQTLQLQYDETLGLYRQERDSSQNNLALYQREQARATALQAQYEQTELQRQHFVTLYTEGQEQLKFERRSKAGIKGWETRRKRENERLKQEIGEMVTVLRDALDSKQTAVDNLYDMANRMDRIQRLMDSVDSETASNPMGLLQKFKLAWEAIQDIFSE